MKRIKQFFAFFISAKAVMPVVRASDFEPVAKSEFTQEQFKQATQSGLEKLRSATF